MAYKFQLGDARLSGSLVQEGTIQTLGDILPLANAGDVALGSSTQEWGGLFLRDNASIRLGTDQDATIAYTPSAGYPGTSDGAILIDAAQVEITNSDTNRPYLIVKDTSNNAIAGQIILFKDRTVFGGNQVDNDELGILNFAGRDSAGDALAYANITGRAVDVTDGSEDGGLLFNARVNGGHPKENLMDINYTLASGVNVKYDLQVGDDIFLKSDSAAIHFGADSEVKLEHEHDDGLTLVSSVASKPVLRIMNNNDDANGAKLRIVKDTSNSAANNDVLGIIDFTGEDSGNAGHVYASITAKSRVVNAGSEEGAIVFAVVDGGSDETNLLDINNTLDGGVTVANGLDVNGHNGSSEGLRLNGTLITTTAAELNLLDGGTAVGSSITLADADGIIVDDAGTMKKIPASDFKSYLADNSLNVALKDNTNTLSNGVNYFADLSGAEAVNLPASPDVGDNVYVKAPSNCSSTNTLTINRQGSHTIDGETSIVLESPHAAVMLVYVVANTWKVF